MSIEEDGPRGPTHHNGQPVLHATYISGGHWQLNISNPELTVWEAPDPARPFGRGFRPPRIPGPFDQGYEVTIDSLGTAIDEASDSRLPLSLDFYKDSFVI